MSAMHAMTIDADMQMFCFAEAWKRVVIITTCQAKQGSPFETRSHFQPHLSSRHLHPSFMSHVVINFNQMVLYWPS